LVLIGGVFFYVCAYNSGNPAVMGHTWDEMQCDEHFCVNTTTGSVGIGTSNPEANLHIKSKQGLSSSFLEIESPEDSVLSFITNFIGKDYFHISSRTDATEGFNYVQFLFGDSFKKFFLIKDNTFPLYIDFNNQRVGIYSPPSPPSPFGDGYPLLDHTLDIGGDLQAQDYYSGSGKKGITTKILVEDNYGHDCILTIENGLIVNTSDCDAV